MGLLAELTPPPSRPQFPAPGSDTESSSSHTDLGSITTGLFCLKKRLAGSQSPRLPLGRFPPFYLREAPSPFPASYASFSFLLPSSFMLCVSPA